MVFIMRKKVWDLECPPPLYCTKEGDPLCFLFHFMFLLERLMDIHREEHLDSICTRASQHAGKVDESRPLGICGKLDWLIPCYLFVWQLPFSCFMSRVHGCVFPGRLFSLCSSVPQQTGEKLRISGLLQSRLFVSWGTPFSLEAGYFKIIL